jgi:hypothetical protein
VTGVLMNARTGGIVTRLALRAGAVTVPSITYSNGGYALRFSPDGRLLAWNRGGSVVLWSVGGVDGRTVASQAVLTAPYNFDPTALAVSNDGAVATVGVNIYPTNLNRNYAVMLVGDQLGRHLQPLGVARFISSPVVGQMSVAATSSGELFSVARASDGSRIFSDSYGASPGRLLQQLCAAASVVITAEQWGTYFPGEPYRPACTARSQLWPWNFGVPHRMAVQPVMSASIPRERSPHVPRPPATTYRRSAASGIVRATPGRLVRRTSRRASERVDDRIAATPSFTATAR